MDSTWLLAIALPALLACSAFFSSAETVFFALNPLTIRRIAQRNARAGALIQRIVAQPTRLLSTILIGNTIVNVATATVGYALIAHWLPGHGEAVAIPAMTLLLLLFGEVGPKQIGLRYTEGFAAFYAPILPWVIRAATPLRLLLERITHRFEPAFRPRGRTLNEEEFETVLDISREEGIINTDELAMIKAIVNLEDLSVSEVMTPRVDVIGVDLNDPGDVIEKAKSARKLFLLLYRDQVDNVEGFLDARKFLLDPERRIDAARLPPFFVADSGPLNTVLARFQREKQRVAVVVDEFGGVAGLVTRGDILEEISGVVYDQLSKPYPMIQNAGPHRWLVDANISLEELNRKLLLDLDSEHADRLAGWIMERVGHLPKQDDVVEGQGCRVRVLQIDKLRITLAQIEKIVGGGA